MLGHKMFQTLSSRFPGVKATIRGSLEDPFYRDIPLFEPSRILERIDVMDLIALRQTLSVERPEVLVNCVGIVKQRSEGKMAVPSITVNSLLPHLLADWVSGWGGRLIHFSTDCVFSGRKGNYSEDDRADAEDLYGKSKFLGEVAQSAQALTLRTSIIGRELSHFQSLLEWFLAQRGGRIRGFRRVIYSGVTTNYLSELVVRVIMECPKLAGLFQVTAPAISKYDLLCRLRSAFGLDIEIVPDDDEVSDRSMVGERFRRATGIAEPEWPSMIGGLIDDPTPYGCWRKENNCV